MKKVVNFFLALLIAGMLSAVGCKKEEKAEPSKKGDTSKKEMTEPAPVPPGTPKY